MAGIFNDGVEIAQIRVLAFSGAGAGGDFLGIYMSCRSMTVGFML